GKLSAGETGCPTRQHREIDVIAKRNFLRVDLEDRFASADIGTPDNNSAIETAWAKQRRIENIGAVRRSDEDHAFVRFETIHLDEQLVQGLLAFIVTAAETRAAMAA